MKWTPRKKSIAFSAAVLVVATALLAAGLVSANGVLSPIREGRDWWQERSLTHHTYSLSVHVGELGEGDVRPLEGVWVSVTRVPTFTNIEEIYASLDAPPSTPEAVFDTTGPTGRTLFELAASADLPLYAIEIFWKDRLAREEVYLGEDMRVRVYFDESGTAYWRWTAHADLEEGRDKASLVVGIVDWRHCELVQQGNATLPSVCDAEGAAPPEVVIHRVDAGERAEKVDIVPVVEAGAARFDLDVGIYDIDVLYEGQQVSERLLLACDWERLHHYDGSTLTLEPQETCGGWASGGEAPPPPGSWESEDQGAS